MNRPGLFRPNALRHIASLTSGLSRKAAIQRHLMPVMIRWFADGVDPDYGLLASVADEQRVFPLTGAPTPDDLDELLSKVWKEPAFFLTHPLAIAAFGRECTRRGVPPPTVSLFGSQFITWRGIPLIPSNKVPVADGKSKILLLRVGDKRQGVVGLFQPGLTGEQSPGLSVRFMGINNHAIASYLISLYCSLAVLTPDALAVLDDVEINKYHDYPDTYK